MTARAAAATLVIITALAAFAFLWAFPSGAFPTRVGNKRSVNVLYAGSLTAVMEKSIGPSFTHKTGYAFQGEGQGSTGAANMMRDGLRKPDVFISADAAVNEKTLMGAANHDLVRWYITFASAELVLGFNPKSKFAPQFEEAQAGHRAWYEVLAEPGVKLGRTDPDLDPKGYRTLFLFSMAQNYYHKPGIVALLGGPHNPAQIFPEPELLARLEAGQVDAAIFYKHEVLAHAWPYIAFPPQLNQGDPALAALYAGQTYMTQKGVLMRGSPILFTATIPVAATDPRGAAEFVEFLLSPDGRKLLARAGLDNVPIRAGGDMNQIPPAIRKRVEGPYKP
jgi:molybdate/tungstate transport system substrate-binding protein